MSLQHVVTSGRLVLREPLTDTNYSLTQVTAADSVLHSLTRVTAAVVKYSLLNARPQSRTCWIIVTLLSATSFAPWLALPWVALGSSDRAMVHLISTYRQRLKLSKPVVRTTKWTSEAVEELHTCLDTTDWEVFRGATDSLDEYTDTVTSYI